jgi:hypothetical protein
MGLLAVVSRCTHASHKTPGMDMTSELDNAALINLGYSVSLFGDTLATGAIGESSSPEHDHAHPLTSHPHR